ncbi:MAG: hypothetical protein OXH83_04270 [Bryobacterales bacterium]|nr:hypothetical protein [Bryobacterales bacterium]MYB52673.1 hypothetical protein [Terriglobia bacterium]MYC68152.1 hypothetical protein [Terriglobia bacterium]
MSVVLLAIGFFGIAMAIMAIGLLSKNRCLRGSCGGPDVLDAEGESLRCGACPRRDEQAATSGDQTTLPPVTSTTEPVT